MTTKKATGDGTAVTKRMSYEAFAHQAIKSLRNPDKSAGIHTVYSGFNSALKAYYGEDAKPVDITQQLAADGKIGLHGARGGVMIYLPNEAPARTDSSGKSTLAKMGIKS